jgi:lysophospholipase L1-like esterase
MNPAIPAPTNAPTRVGAAAPAEGGQGGRGRYGLRFFCLALWGWGLVAEPLQAETTQPVPPLTIQTQTLQIRNAGASHVALVCPRKGPATTRPTTPPAEPTEIPGDDEVKQAQQEASAYTLASPARHSPLLQGDPRSWRIAVWGDSHMAAAFFSDQMVRQLVSGDAEVSSRFIHAGVGHGGVRALVRKTCLSGDWTREMAYAHADAAATPGPGMTSLVAKRPGASLALDLRDAQGLARHTRLRMLVHGDGTGSTQLAISVDGEAETPVRLEPSTGPSALELHTSAAVSSLHIRVVEGPFRFQGLKLMDAPAPALAPAALHLDLFAYPGATVAGWVRSDLGYLATWFNDQPYDLALMAFGTNEGNDPHFNDATYRDMLTRAGGNFRQVFPQTQCVLIGPADRGIRVAKTAKAPPNTSRKKPAAKGKTPPNTRNPQATAVAPSAKSRPAAKLLKYARIHAQIGQIQSEVAAQHGCLYWSMQAAMGGLGSAYTWARQNPPRMAPDLIHLTPAGYRELANAFLADFGLTQP